MSERELERLYGSAELIINLHGGTEPLPEHAATGRLVYLETDPVQLQIELYDGLAGDDRLPRAALRLLHLRRELRAARLRLPVDDRFHFLPTRQPVVLDFWPDGDERPGRLHDVGNWRQHWRDVTFEGERYTWSKHHEFLQVPRPARARAGQAFELALSELRGRRTASCSRARLAGPRRARASRASIDRYRDYIGALARRVHRRQGAERAPAHRLVQRPQRDLPGRGAAGGHPGHRLRQRAADRRGPVRVLDSSTRPLAAVEAIDARLRRTRARRREIAREYFDP